MESEAPDELGLNQAQRQGAGSVTGYILSATQPQAVLFCPKQHSSKQPVDRSSDFEFAEGFGRSRFVCRFDQKA